MTLRRISEEDFKDFPSTRIHVKEDARKSREWNLSKNDPISLKPMTEST